jgi:rare lipoprotein A
MRWLLFISLCLIFPAAWGQRDSASVITQTGIASYYAKKFEGRKCSCGERFRHGGLTAAHKSLPFGTWVKVTNLKNDSSVIVRINDRLPRSSRRLIDLTQRAAKQLNFIKAGLTKVRIEVLKDSLP